MVLRGQCPLSALNQAGGYFRTLLMGSVSVASKQASSRTTTSTWHNSIGSRVTVQSWRGAQAWTVIAMAVRRHTRAAIAMCRNSGDDDAYPSHDEHIELLEIAMRRARSVPQGGRRFAPPPSEQCNSRLTLTVRVKAARDGEIRDALGCESVNGAAQRCLRTG